MSSSGTYNFSLGNADCLIEALSRCQIRGPEITTTHMTEGVRSLNLILQTEFLVRGVNLWEVEAGLTIPLVAPVGTLGQTVYPLPANLFQILNVRYSMPQQNGGVIDRLMLPIGRDDYAAYPSKTIAGTPTVYWFERLIPPQLTIWSPDQVGPPNFLSYDMMRVSQDAAAGMGQTPDVRNSFLDALCASLAHRLCRKFWSDLVRTKKMSEQGALKMMGDLKGEAEQAWELAALDDQEMAPLNLQPDLTQYYSPR